jgi:hypothetical protein
MATACRGIGHQNPKSVLLADRIAEARRIIDARNQYCPLISLGYLEEDGVLLAISLQAAIVVLALDLGLIWEQLHGAKPMRLFGSFIDLAAPLGRADVDLRAFSAAKG